MSLDTGFLSTAFVDTLTKNYFNFQGRTSRFGYWHYILAYVAFAIVVAIVTSMLGGLGELISTIIALGVILPNVGIAVRRLHDTGKTGWLVLIGLIPVLGWIAIIYFLAQPGDSGDNMYGPVPATKAV